MRKNRNSFFTESNMNYSNFQAQGAIPQAMPYANANYNPYQVQPNVGMPYVDRLNARVNKLESLNTTFVDDNIDVSSNMYML